MKSKAKIKAKARVWLTSIEKVIKEHQTIEGKMDNPDDYEEFVAVGIALSGIESELQALIDS